MKTLYTNGGIEFISIRFCNFCKKWGIIIKYTALYMYKENKLAKRGWKTIVAIKDTMLINNGFSNNFWAKVIETAN